MFTYAVILTRSPLVYTLVGANLWTQFPNPESFSRALVTSHHNLQAHRKRDSHATSFWQ